ERGQDRGQVTFAFQKRPRAGLDRHVQFVGNDLRQGCLSEARRSVEQHVVQRFATAARRVDSNLDILFDAFLPDVFIQALWPHAHVDPSVFVKRLSRHNPLGLSLWHHVLCRSISNSYLRFPSAISSFVWSFMPHARPALLGRSTTAMRRAATAQNFQRPLGSSL